MRERPTPQPPRAVAVHLDVNRALRSVNSTVVDQVADNDLGHGRGATIVSLQWLDAAQRPRHGRGRPDRTPGAVNISIDIVSPVPPFEQLRTQIATQVADGTLPAGTKLATVRQMATDLGLAANTVARAYRELEADGVISTYGRRGTFIRSAALDDPATASAELAEGFVHDARRRGLTLAEALAIVERAWTR